MTAAKVLLALTVTVSVTTVVADTVAADTDDGTVAAADNTVAVTADDVELDFAAGTRTYRGGVVLRHRGVQLFCDALVTDHAGDAVATGVCTGAPAKFHHLSGGDDGASGVVTDNSGGDDGAADMPTGNTGMVTGSARTITVDRAAATVTLAGDAAVNRGGESLSGGAITYHLAGDKLSVDGGGGARARLTIPPPQ